MTLSERIIKFRAVNGLTQAQFAERAGVSKSTISHLEIAENWYVSRVNRERIEYALNGGIVKKMKEE